MASWDGLHSSQKSNDTTHPGRETLVQVLGGTFGKIAIKSCIGMMRLGCILVAAAAAKECKKNLMA